MLRNTRQELHTILQVPLMEQLAKTMMISGYPEDFRSGVLESAVTCYEQQLAASNTGVKPLYRPGPGSAQPGEGRCLLLKWPGLDQQIQY